MSTLIPAWVWDRRRLHALIALRNGMFAHDAWLNDDKKEGGSTAPTGDDYNELFDRVLDALTEAGIPFGEPKEDAQ